MLAACAALVLAASPASGSRSATRACLPVSVYDRSGAFTYAVRVEAGDVGCGLARAVLRDAADWPPGEVAATAPWRCAVGHDPRSWAISCAHRGALVRA